MSSKTFNSKTNQTSLIFYASPESIDIFDEIFESVCKKSTSNFKLIASHSKKSKHAEYFFSDFNYSDFKYSENDLLDFFNTVGNDVRYIYESDQDFLFQYYDEEFFVKKTLFALKKILKLKKQYNFQNLFLVGGGSLLTNLLMELYQFDPNVNIKRFPPMSYLNNDESLPRVGAFGNNNYLFSLEKKNEPIENWCLEIANAYYDNLTSKKITPDKISRSAAKVGAYCPKNYFSFLVDLAKYFGKLTYNLLTPNRKKNTFITKLRVKAYIFKNILSLNYFFKPIKVTKNKPYFILILHHPIDSQLTFRGRAYRDQIATARMIARNLPVNSILYIKEHPVYPGAFNPLDVFILEKSFRNVRFLDFSFSFQDFLPHCSAVLTVNSTAGIEAMVNGIPVITFGDGFYADMDNIYKIRDFSNFTKTLSECIYSPKSPSRKDVVEMLAKTISYTYPKRLNNKKESKIDVIVEAILHEVSLNP